MVNLCKVVLCSQKGEHPKAFVECFIQNFQRHFALYPEAPVHRNLFISPLVGNFLPDLKRQIQIRVVRWTSPLLSMIVEAETQFFEDSLQGCKTKRKLKPTILNLSLESLERQKRDSELLSSHSDPFLFAFRHLQILQKKKNPNIGSQLFCISEKVEKIEIP